MHSRADFNKLRKAFVDKTRLPCISLSMVDREPEITENKFAGVPFIPVGETVPKTSKGDPMSLVLQVHLKDVQLPDWPDKGMLSVFYGDIYDCWPNEWAVRIFDDTQPHVPEAELPEPRPHVFDRAWGMEMVPSEAFMPMDDFRWSNTVGSLIKELFGVSLKKSPRSHSYIWGYIDDFLGHEFDFGTHVVNGVDRAVHWSDLWPASGPLLTLGGYANFTQTDPRDYEADKAMTTCLFKIDSWYDLQNINLSDAGIMSGIIKPEDLQAGKVENTFLHWDCC